MLYYYYYSCFWAVPDAFPVTPDAFGRVLRRRTLSGAAERFPDAVWYKMRNGVTA